MSDDLAARIEAALDEKQRTAEEATQGPWKLWGMEVRADQVGNSDLDDSYLVARTFDEARGLRTFNANHIAANDPASVLRQVAGMREIAEAHKADQGVCSVCVDVDAWTSMDDSPDSLPLLDYPCPTLLAVASMLGVDEGEK